jgi:hypothetical protein
VAFCFAQVSVNTVGDTRGMSMQTSRRNIKSNALTELYVFVLYRYYILQAVRL